MDIHYIRKQVITHVSIIGTLALVILSCTKSFDVPGPQEMARWQKFYGSYDNDHLSDVCLTPTGHALIGTTIINQGVKEKFFLIGADHQGYETWRDTSKENEGVVNGHALAVSGNNILAVIGKSVPGTRPKMMVLTYTMQGKCTDTTAITVDVPGTLGLKEIRFTHSDTEGASLIVLDSLANEDACITYKLKNKVLTMGSILKLQGRAVTNRIYLTEKNTTTAYLAVSISGETNSSQYIRVARIDNDIFQWSFIYNYAGYKEQTAGVLLKPDTLMVASSFKTDNDSTGITLWKLNEQGRLLKRKVTFLKGYHVLHECVKPGNDTIIFTGEGQISNKGSDIFFATVHSNAQVINTVFYGNSGYSSGKFIRYLQTGKNYLIAGDVYNSTNFDCFVTKANTQGIWTH